MSQNIKSKETYYDGYRFRSRLEARWAVFFNNIGLEYEYEVEGFDKEGFRMMTDAEKKLLQAQHRLEEAQARDRVKERKARTRRLIQEGAILEKVLPEVRTMEPTVLED